MSRKLEASGELALAGHLKNDLHRFALKPVNAIWCVSFNNVPNQGLTRVMEDHCQIQILFIIAPPLAGDLALFE
jgi:hypothetical protein